jgi:hypothetical protein
MVPYKSRIKYTNKIDRHGREQERPCERKRVENRVGKRVKKREIVWPNTNKEIIRF